MLGFWILIAVLLVFALVMIAVYNGLVQKRVRCQSAWSQIDVQLKRRYDLIPNLVETVKGYASHEKDTLEAVIQARSGAIDAKGIAEQAGAENMLTGALGKLFALSESYPDLKANENFSMMQEELTTTENKIAFSRQHYNDSAAVYNTARMKFPNNIIANMFGFGDQEYFELEDASQKEAPKVSF